MQQAIDAPGVENIATNFAAWQLRLTDEEMQHIAALDRHEALG